VDDKILRQHLRVLLSGAEAHVDWASALKGLPKKLRGARPKGADHSLWELLEHARIAQWDILEFCRNPKHVSPEWPSGYWPKQASPGKIRGMGPEREIVPQRFGVDGEARDES
jgi:hypothetical protein